MKPIPRTYILIFTLTLIPLTLSRPFSFDELRTNGRVEGPASGLRVSQESTGLEELQRTLTPTAGLEEVLPQPRDLDERLRRLEDLSREGDPKTIRARLGALASPEDKTHPVLPLQVILKRLIKKKPLIAIRPMALTSVKTPWGKIDLTRLNDWSRYEREFALVELGRDLELAHWLGLLHTKPSRGGSTAGASPSGLYDRIVQKKHPTGARRIATPWIVWANLLLDARTLEQTKTWVSGDGKVRLQYQSTPTGPLFTLNGRTLSDPAQAEVVFFAAHSGVNNFHFSSAALPEELRQTFGWPKLNGSLKDPPAQFVSILKEIIPIGPPEKTDRPPEENLSPMTNSASPLSQMASEQYARFLLDATRATSHSKRRRILSQVQEALRDHLWDALTRKIFSDKSLGLTLDEAHQMVSNLSTQLARQADPSQWNPSVQEALVTQITEEVQILLREPYPFTWRILSELLPRRSLSETAALFAHPPAAGMEEPAPVHPFIRQILENVGDPTGSNSEEFDSQSFSSVGLEEPA